MTEKLSKNFAQADIKPADQYGAVVFLDIGGDPATGNPLVYLGRQGKGHIAAVDQKWLSRAEEGGHVLSPQDLVRSHNLKDYAKDLISMMRNFEVPFSYDGRIEILEEMGQHMDMGEDMTPGPGIPQL